MDSLTLYTEEIDDLAEAAADLFEQASSFAFRKNTIAILFAEEDTDFPGLYALLSARWKFPVMGCTALSMLLGKEGYCDIGISVMLLTADDCEFSVGMTDELNMDNYREAVSATYKRLSAALPSKEKLIISYGGLVNTEDDVGGDDRVNILNDLSGGVPVYGAAASDSFNFKNLRLFYNGKTSERGQVMALVAGNVAPRFICVNSIENKSEFAYEVTEARGNQVFRLGNDTFIDTLRRENMVSDKTNVMADYLLSPFVVTVRKENGDSVQSARTLSVLNHENGSGSFLGVIPKDSVLGIGIISRDDVQHSIEEAVDRMLERLKESGQEYRTMLCTSCCARFLALASNTRAEAQALQNRIPPSMALLGMYSFGEYCPAVGNVTGTEYNLYHNFTFTILAL